MLEKLERAFFLIPIEIEIAELLESRCPVRSLILLGCDSIAIIVDILMYPRHAECIYRNDILMFVFYFSHLYVNCIVLLQAKNIV